MAVPRPVLLALVGLGLLASVYLVTRSGSHEAVNSSATPVTRPVAPAPAQKRSAQRPAERAKAAPKRSAGPRAAAPAANTTEGRVHAAAQALSQGKVVVFFFSKEGPADDVGARAAVRSLRGMSRVEIFDAGLEEVAAYRPMLSNVGISQVPSTVIVRPGKKAVLIQGFVDAGTLRQNVADALR
jgi:hypothetical protein